MKFIFLITIAVYASIQAAPSTRHEHLLEHSALLYSNAHQDFRSALETLVKIGRLSSEQEQSIQSELKNEKIEMGTPLSMGKMKKDTMSWGRFKLKITGSQTLQTERGTYIRTQGKTPDQIFKEILKVDSPSKNSFYIFELALVQVHAVDKDFYSNIGSAYRSAISSIERASGAIANMWSALPLNQPSKLEEETKNGVFYQNGFLANLLKSNRDLKVQCDNRSGRYIVIHGFNESVWSLALEDWRNDEKKFAGRTQDPSEPTSPTWAVMFKDEVKQQIEKSNQWYEELQLKSLSDERMKKILQTTTVPKCTATHADLIEKALKSEATCFYASMAQAIGRPLSAAPPVMPSGLNRR